MSEANRSSRVFISYARSDCNAFAEELLAGLEAAGFDAFLDRHDIGGGEDWEARLQNLLQQADTVVFVLSPASVVSERCGWEIDLADALSKRIIPVVAIDVTEAATPAKLKRLNYIFFSPGHSFGAALRDLSAALRTDLAWVREHTRLAELSARWRDRNKPEELLLRGAELGAATSWIAGWKAGAPEPTVQQRDFINESEAAETTRSSVERKRLEEITTAQADRGRALQRVARLTLIGGGIVIALFVAVVVFWVVLRNTQNQLADKDANLAELQTQIEDKDKLLAEKQAELLSAAAKLSSADGISAKPGTAVRSETTTAAQELVRQARVDLGWNIDLFWCAGAAAAQNRSKAEAIERILTEEQKRQAQAGAPSGAGLAFPIGRVRVRTLDEATNARSGYGIDADVIRADRNELEQSEALRRFVMARQGPTLGDAMSAMGTSTISAHFCAGRLANEAVLPPCSPVLDLDRIMTG